MNLDEAFEDLMRECYSETITIGFLKDDDTVSAMKALYSIAWQCAQSDWESEEESEGNILSVDDGLTYYYVSDIGTLS